MTSRVTEQTPGQKIAQAILRCIDAQNVRYADRGAAMVDAHHRLIEEIDAALLANGELPKND